MPPQQRCVWSPGPLEISCSRLHCGQVARANSAGSPDELPWPELASTMPAAGSSSEALAISGELARDANPGAHFISSRPNNFMQPMPPQQRNVCRPGPPQTSPTCLHSCWHRMSLRISEPTMTLLQAMPPQQRCVWSPGPPQISCSRLHRGQVARANSAASPDELPWPELASTLPATGSSSEALAISGELARDANPGAHFISSRPNNFMQPMPPQQRNVCRPGPPQTSPTCLHSCWHRMSLRISEPTTTFLQAMPPQQRSVSPM